MLPASSLRERVELPRISPPLAAVEVGRGRADRNQANVDVDAVAGADDVAEEPPVSVHAVGRRLGHQSNPRADW